MAAAPSFKSWHKSSSVTPFPTPPHNWLHLPELPFSLSFLAAIVSPGRRGPVVWSNPSPSSHASAITKGSCLPVVSWVKVTPIFLPSLLFICKITIFAYQVWSWPAVDMQNNSQWPCSTSPIPHGGPTCWGGVSYILYFWDTPSSETCFESFIWGTLAAPITHVLNLTSRRCPSLANQPWIDWKVGAFGSFGLFT